MSTHQKSEFEFIALMAFLMANAALAIDGVLPGLNGIGASLQVVSDNNLQLVITMILVGLGVGQLFFGTLSDSFGRKPMVYAGMITFIVASLICVSANSLPVMLIGRILQGIGLSAPRSISTSIIRDCYSGDHMARIMSFISAVFILVPMVAPLIGQVILHYYSWHYIFMFQIGFILLVMLWFRLRQEETLKPENKRAFTFRLFYEGMIEFFGISQTVVYTIISGLIGGCFFVYLSTSKQLFIDQYGLNDEFGYVFAALAFSIGVASFLNSTLVLRFGMRKLAVIFLALFTVSATIYCGLFLGKPNPHLAVLMTFFAVQFLSLGFVFGNMRSLAMEPIGHISGIGAAINGFISTLLSVPIAIVIGVFITNSAVPLFIGFLVCGALSLFLMFLVKKDPVADM